MSGERTIVLWCPDWPVHAASSQAGLDADAAVALIDRGLVYACSAAARSEGVRRGLKLREAQLRSPALTVLDYDAALDARVFEPVIRLVEATVPGVQIIRPGTLAMRARGPARYYGGEEAAAEALLATAERAGVQGSRIGIADGAFAAEQAARASGAAGRTGIVPAGEAAAFIAPLPVGLLVDERTATLLHRLGIRTLGELAALPEADVRRRFGAAGAFAHARASAREDARVRARTPPPDHEVEARYEPPLDRIDALAFAFRTRAEEFENRLRAAKLVCTALRVEIVDDRGGRSEREWLHPRWFTAADVVDRVRWQLQGGGSADRGLAAPIAHVRIAPARVDDAAAHETGLWGGGPDERVHHGLTRVQSMLGHDAVVTGSVGGGRMLADRQVFVPWGDRLPPSTRERPWPGSLPGQAPSSVFRDRAPVLVLDAAGEPVRVDERGAISAPPERFAPPASAGKHGPKGAHEAHGGERRVQAWAGPWPVVERWWDAEAARRLYRFQLVDDAGQAWLLVLDETGWRAEARYD
ncbi:DNA polymerase Y family protein [Agromyces archimandritae]|uniref:DNA polymerase Y family protein n=1 Tax=Agromyces archimandritae TaxID=2781962 RepID=A0A975FMP8_9MICO|nr:DNA polymerase Y family protein [Agromyces archimandritae]QTX04751.1 DNA polymerase Y family protein [Agromyces archimandritae]